jgi:hypothetical protein
LYTASPDGVWASAFPAKKAARRTTGLFVMTAYHATSKILTVVVGESGNSAI